MVSAIERFHCVIDNEVVTSSNIQCLLVKTKKWLILGGSLTHLVGRRDLLFLEAEKADNIFQWDVIKYMWQMKSCHGMFQDIKAFTGNRILKTRISSRKSLQNKSFSRLLSNALI